MPRIKMIWVTLIAVVLMTATATAGKPLNKHEALSSIDQSTVAEQLATMNRLAGSGALTLAQVQKVIASSNLNDVEREFFLYRLLLSMRSQAATDANLEIVQALKTFENEIYVWHDEGAHAIPMFAIRSAAHGAMNNWRSIETRDALLARFSVGDFNDLAIFTVPLNADTRPARTGAIAALQRTDVSVLSGARDWMLGSASSSNHEAAMYDEALAVIAVRTHDANLYRHVLMTGSGPATIRLLATVSDNLAADDAYGVLTGTMQRADLASAALFQMGRLIGRHPDARDQIISSLTNPDTGGTAAAVIARSDDPDLLKQASSYMAAGGLTAKRAVLALKLNNSGYARSLAMANVGTLTDNRLKQEVNSWLAQ